MHQHDESDIVSTGMAIGAGFVTDFLAGVAMYHLRETSENGEPEEPATPPAQPVSEEPMSEEEPIGEEPAEEESAEEEPVDEFVVAEEIVVEEAPAEETPVEERSEEQPPEKPVEKPAEKLQGEIVPARKRELQLPKVIGADVESTVAFSGEDLGVFGSLEFLESTTWRASYVAKIVNDSDEDLYCARFGESGSRRTELQPSEFVVDPHAASAVIVDVPLRLWDRFDTVLVTMRNRSVHCSLNAQVPYSSAFVPAVSGLAAIVLLICGFFAYNAVKPQIVAYAAPSATLAGSSMRAAYAVSGMGIASYEIADISQLKSPVLASGTLASGQGFFSFNTPDKPDRYRLSLHVKGPLGNVTQNQYLQTVAASSMSRSVLQLIRSFEVDDALVESGNPIVLRYIASGKGQVRLLDAAQIPVAVQTTDPHGITKIPAPNVNTDTPYRLELIAKNGNATQTASVGILVQPGDDFSSVTGDAVSTQGGFSALNPKDVAAIDAASNAAGGSKFLQIDPPYVRGGSTFRVRILQKVSHFQVSLQNAQGVPITMRTAGPAQRVVSFAVPAVSSDVGFILVANFRLNGEAQTVLKPFTVHAQ